MLEEVPTEETPQDTAQVAEQAEPTSRRREKEDSWDDQDYEYFFGETLDDGYRPRQPQEVKSCRRSRARCRRRGRSPPPDLAAQSSARRRHDARDSRRHHRRHRRRRHAGGVGRRDCRPWRVRHLTGREGARARPDLRPDRRRRARPPGCLLLQFRHHGFGGFRSRRWSATICGFSSTTRSSSSPSR